MRAALVWFVVAQAACTSRSGPHDAVAATYAALGITPTWLPH